MTRTGDRRWCCSGAGAVLRSSASPAGGELQRFAIAVVAAQEADVYMIDEPSSYLDVRQRLKAARVGACAAHPLTVRQQRRFGYPAY